MNLLTGWYFTGLNHYDWFMVDVVVIALVLAVAGIAIIRSR